MSCEFHIFNYYYYYYLSLIYCIWSIEAAGRWATEEKPLVNKAAVLYIGRIPHGFYEKEMHGILILNIFQNGVECVSVIGIADWFLLQLSLANLVPSRG